MNKPRLIAILAIFLISLLAPEAQAANHLPPTSVPFPAPQQEDNPRPAQLGENRGEAPIGEREVWIYQGQAGEVLTIKAEADKPTNEASDRTGLLDMLLLVYAPDGTLLAKADDIEFGIVSDALIEGLELPVDGVYRLEVSGWKTHTGGEYTLTMQLASTVVVTPIPTPATDPNWPTLTITNNLEESVCVVYISSVSSDSWGDDWLEAAELFPPDHSRQWHVPIDIVDILLTDCEGNTLDIIYKFDMTRSSTLTIPIPIDGPVGQCAKGVQLFFDGKVTEALPLLEAGFAGRKEAIFSHLDDEGDCAFALGELRDDTGDRFGALEAYEVALGIFKASGNRRVEGSTLNNIGLVYDNQGRFDLALETYQQALEIKREIGDRAGEGATLNNIGLTYRNQGHFDLALQSYQQALEIKREIGDRATEGTTLHNMAHVYDNQGRFDLALENYQQALEIRREVGDRFGEGATLNNIGAVYDNQGRFDLALQSYQQALEIRREVSNRSGEGVTLNNIGTLYDNQGRFDLALQSYQQALEIRREVGDRAGEGTTLNNIGTVYNKQGRFDFALQSYQQALEIRREVGNRTGEGATLNNIATIYTKQGRFDLALQSYQQALEITREIGYRVGEGLTLNNIGDVYDRQRRVDLALQSYQQALEIVRDANAGYRDGEGATLNNIGTVYNKQGRFDLALENYQQALEIAREVGNHVREGTTLNNIGNVYNKQERFDLALQNYQQALEIAHEVGDRAGEGATLNNLAFIYQRQGQLDKALTHYELAMDIFEQLRAEAGSEEGRASFIAQHAQLYEQAIDLYHEQDKNEDAFRTSERARSRSFLDSLSTGYVQLSDNDAQELLDQEREVYAARQATQDALARAKALNPPDPELVADLEQQLAEAEQAHKAALSAIEARGGKLAELVPNRTKQVSLSEIQANLSENTTLVSYYILGDNDTLAFILTSDELNVVPLAVGSQALTDQITAFYQSFTDPFFDQVDPHDSKELQQLHEWLIMPLKPHIYTPGVTIVPHGILHYLPFATLTDGESYFSDQYVLSTLPSASVLPSIQENRKPDTVIESVLALGNPTFDPELATQERLTLSNLPFARQEVETLTNLFGDQVEAHFGPDATESRLKEAGQANILHIAAHGVYNPEQPLNSKLFLAPDGTNNGLLEVGEAYGLELTDSTLVVLSACETGIRSRVGREESVVTDGDEIVALNRAFLFAGTPTVLSTLWSVDDKVTTQLMERFYTHLHDGKGKAEALRQAQIDVQEEYAHPYYWAGFVLSGDGGEVTKPETTASPTETAVSEPEAMASPTETAVSEPEDETTWPPIIGLAGLLVAIVLLVGGLILRKRSK